MLLLPFRFSRQLRRALRSKDLRRWTGWVRPSQSLPWKRRQAASWANRHANGAVRLQERAGQSREAAVRPLPAAVRSAPARPQAGQRQFWKVPGPDILPAIHQGAQTALPWILAENRGAGPRNDDCRSRDEVRGSNNRDHFPDLSRGRHHGPGLAEKRTLKEGGHGHRRGGNRDRKSTRLN